MTTKLHFWDAGDHSVGINSNQVVIELELEGSNAQETTENIAHAKEVLSKALGEIWDNGKVQCMTEEEIRGDEQPIFELVDVLKDRVAEGHPIHVTGQPSKEIMSAIESVAQGIAEDTDQPVQIVHHIELPIK